MSVLSSISVATPGSSAQAPAAAGAPDGAADSSPFAMLLAAIVAADPDLQAPVQTNPLQTNQTNSQQTQPASGVQTPAVPSPQAPAANDDGDGDDTGMPVTVGAAANSQAVNLPQIPQAPDDAPKSGKTDKKADADKSNSDASAEQQPPQTPNFALLPVPIPPVAQAAVQAQTVAGNDNEDDALASPLAGVGDSANGVPQPQINSGSKPVIPITSGAQPDSSAPLAASNSANGTAAPPVSSALAAASDDGGDGDANGAITADPVLSALQTAGAKFAGVQNGKPPASQPTPPSSTPAPADNDMDAPQTQASSANASVPVAGPPALAAANTASISKTQAPSIGTSTQAAGPPAPDVANTASISIAMPEDPQKPAAANKPAQSPAQNGGAASAPSGNNVAANMAATNQNFAPAQSMAADNSDGTKPAHIAPAATTSQPDAPQPPAPVATDAVPQNSPALGIGGQSTPNTLTLPVHVAIHDADSQSTPALTPNTDALAVSIAARSISGAKQFDIRLDPPELGRVDVRLSIDATGKTQAHMTADQPQTLTLLQKDAPSLTRALRDAGLDVSQNGLNFSLKGQDRNQGGQGGNFGAPSRSLSLPLAAQSAEAGQSGISYSPLSGNARLDIHV